MTWIVTTDLHLSDRPRDAYRWPIFDWLAKQQQKHKVDATFILGDLTDRKDNHSSALVNRVIDELLKLKPPVYILRGNHDGIDHSNPFFRFLQTIEGLDFVVEPTVVEGMLEQGVAMIPHQPDQAALDRACGIVRPKMAGVMMHQTLDGAMAETGTHLTGLRASLVEAKRPLRWYSGDVHSPQALNCGLTYVGAPYHVRFGDGYEPRVLLVGNTETDLHFPCLKKWTFYVKGADPLLPPRVLSDTKKGDHVKIIVTLPPEEVVGWAAVKRRILDTCREMEVQVFGIELEIEGSREQGEVRSDPVHTKTPVDIYEAFCAHEKIADNIKEVGEEFVSN